MLKKAASILCLGIEAAAFCLTGIWAAHSKILAPSKPAEFSAHG
jgi:hypothetical protein